MARREGIGRWLARALCVPLALACFQAAWAGQEATPLERQVKAAYLFKFASFIEWPEGSFVRPDSALVIGVAGNEALAEQLEQTVAGHSVNGRAVQVRRLRRGDALGGVHILFVGDNDKGAMQELFGAARGQSLLTVSDSDEATALGSMVNFVMADDKLRFEVALRPVGASRLRISARMLAAAHRVHPGGAS